MARRCETPNSPQNIKKQADIQKVLDMRILGASYRRIGEKLGISYQTVSNYLSESLVEFNDTGKAKVKELQKIELMRLEVACNAIAAKVLEGDLQAVDRWVRLSERRSKLLGLDAPEELTVRTETPLDDLSDDEVLAAAKRAVDLAVETTQTESTEENKGEDS